MNIQLPLVLKVDPLPCREKFMVQATLASIEAIFPGRAGVSRGGWRL